MKLLLFMGIIGAAGCAGMETNHVEVDPILRPQFTSFLTEATLHGRTIGSVGLRVKFGNVPTTLVGYCVKPSIGPREVVISKTSWLLMNYYEQELLMFHELGHCLLNLEHDNTLDVYGMPKSIMNWLMFDSYYYESHREEYLNKLFNYIKLN